MRHACVIGWPIAHSRSPLIHGYWLSEHGIDGAYTREPVRPEDLTAFLRDLETRGLAGCNVTVPHKEAALALASETDDCARSIGAANTLWIEDHRLCATNTDSYGYMTYLDARAPVWRTRDRPVAILGAGGAARAIIYGFLQAGVSEVWLFNRSLARAESLAQHFGPRVRARTWDQRNVGAREASVIVNATTLGMKGKGDPDVDFAACDPATVVSDIVYVPLETPFLQRARTAGLTTVDGLGMLLHQAVPGFEKWFGVRPAVTDALYARVRADIEGAG